MLNEATISELQLAATKKICSGNLTVEQLQNFLNPEISAPNRVIRSFDVYSDGKVLKHIASEKEAIDYACRCESLDELVKKMVSSRAAYLELVKNAERARAVKEEKKQAAKEAQAAQEAQAEEAVQSEQAEG